MVVIIIGSGSGSGSGGGSGGGSGSGSGTSAVIDGCLFVYLFWLDWVEWRMRLWYGGMRKGKEGGGRRWFMCLIKGCDCCRWDD